MDNIQDNVPQILARPAARAAKEQEDYQREPQTLIEHSYV